MSVATHSSSSAPVLLFVLGMHRSGTSALTRVLDLLGFQNARALMPANTFNKLGYFEASGAVKINESLLQDASSFWFDPEPVDFDVFPAELVEKYTAQTRKFLETEFSEGTHFVLKDPRISKTFPIWRKAAEDAGFQVRCMLACRHPQEVAASLARRDQMTSAHALELWQSYMFDAERYSRHTPRMTVLYDALMAEWRSVMTDTLHALGLSLDDFPNRDEAAIDGFLSPSLRNFKDAEDGDASSPAMKLYQTFCGNPALTNTEVFDALFSDWKTQRSEDPLGDYALTFPVGVMAKVDQLREDGKAEHAEAVLFKGVDAFPMNGRLREEAATSLLLSDRIDQAAALLGQPPPEGGESGELLYVKAEVLLRQGDKPGAIALMEKSLNVRSDALHVRRRYANTLLDNQEYEKAAAVFKTVLEVDPNLPHMHAGLARALLNSGEFEDAKHSIDKAIAIAADKPGFFNILGRIEFQLEHFDAAETAYRQAIELNSQLAPSYAGLGQVLTHQKRSTEALEPLKRAVELAPDNADVRFNLGQVLMHLGEFDLAKVALKGAIQLNDQKPAFHFWLGKALRALGEIEAADLCDQTGQALLAKRAAD